MPEKAFRLVRPRCEIGTLRALDAGLVYFLSEARNRRYLRAHRIIVIDLVDDPQEIARLAVSEEGARDTLGSKKIK